MDVTGLTSLLISTLIYHELSNSFSAADKEFQPSSQNLTQYPLDNITVQLLKNNFGNNCDTHVNMTCTTSLPPNLICGFEWRRDEKKIDGQNQSTLVWKITKKVTFTCIVLSPFGNFSSSNDINCPETDATTVLLICGVGAFIVILMFGITMKIMLKRGEVERQARRQQRQAMQSNDSSATVTSYW